MAEKCQIIPKTVFASCETYNCLKPVAWAIGRPDGPVQKMVFFCDQCMRDMVLNIPDGLADCLPIMGIGIIDGYVALSCNRAKEVAEALPDGDIKVLFEKIIAMVDEDVKEYSYHKPTPDPVSMSFKPSKEAQREALLELAGEMSKPVNTDTPQPPKTYACKYCGEVFDTPTKVGSHTRYCQAKKEAKPDNEEKEG
jgi:hypothetical protein